MTNLSNYKSQILLGQILLHRRGHIAAILVSSLLNPFLLNKTCLNEIFCGTYGALIVRSGLSPVVAYLSGRWSSLSSSRTCVPWCSCAARWAASVWPMCHRIPCTPRAWARHRTGSRCSEARACGAGTLSHYRSAPVCPPRVTQGSEG